MKYKAFISYRRSDSTERAQLLKKILKSHGYDNDEIFLDLYTIHEGEFPKHIQNALHNTEYFILLISNESFCRNEVKDFYLDEIKTAMELNLKIIPILFDGIKIEEVRLPKALEGLSLKNSISYNAEYQDAFDAKVKEFMTANNLKWGDLIKIPTVIITIYLIVSLLCGVALYVRDNYFMPEREQVEVVSERLQEVGQGDFLYLTSHAVYIYNVKSQILNVFYGDAKDAYSTTIKSDQFASVGFWGVSIGLVYEFTKCRVKPHGGGKVVLGYVVATISVVLGAGLGCTLERMIYPKYNSALIIKQLENRDFWKEVIKEKFSHRTIYFQ